MITIQDKNECCGCNACVQKCPKQCIDMVEDNEGFLYPNINISKCINCGLCEKVCPVLNQGEERQPLSVFAAKNLDDEIRQQSSSGGIFTMLAECIIARGGVVFGAGFNEQWEVVHQYTETQEGLAAFRGSKYVQSNIGDTYKQAETFLKQGREVLFSGTPCQIRGLKLFLGKEYESLLTVDFICHGVPSPGVFRTYLNEEIEKFAYQSDGNSIVSPSSIHCISEKENLSIKTNKIQIEAISFRDKKEGWQKYSFVLVLSKTLATGGKNIVSSSYTLREHPFLRGFLADLYLRPSCYLCPTKKMKSGADLTIADYWRIHELIPQLNDDKGISAVLVNTNKGKFIFDVIDAAKYPTNYKDIYLKNSAIYNSAPIPTKRKDFFTPTPETFTAKIERLCHPTLGDTIKKNLYSLLRSTEFFKIVKNVKK